MTDLTWLFNELHPGKYNIEYFEKKFNTDFSGKSYIGYIAFAENGEPAAYYGVFPCILYNRHGEILACQSGDTITHKRHQRKGIFVQFAQKTYDLAQKEGIKLVFGFPNDNSAPGFYNKLGWEKSSQFLHLEFSVNSFNLYALSNKIKLLSGLYKRYFNSRVLNIQSKEIDIYNNYDDDVLRTRKDKAYILYKLSYSNSYLVEIDGFKFWFKLDDGLLIGAVSNFEPNQKVLFKEANIKLAKFFGVKKIRIITTRSNFEFDAYSDFCETQEIPISNGFLKLDSAFNLVIFLFQH
ncbi:MAG: GNAT family N-acetyltransferase [Flavobacteriales bacterium]